MAVWTQSFGILDGVFAAARERDTMVNLKTGRAEMIPDWIAAKYSV